MLALPSMGGIPAELHSASTNTVAAKLALATMGQVPPRVRRHVQGLEIDTLHAALAGWLHKLQEPMEYFGPGVHVNIAGEDDELMASVWLGTQSDLIGSTWYLEDTWKRLEKRQQGLAAWALSTVQHASYHSFPVYTPVTCDWHAQWNWWRGEDDEAGILEEYREEIGDPKAPPPADMITREKFDKALPPFVQRPNPRLALLRRLEQLAKAPVMGALHHISRLVLELRTEIKAAHRAEDPEMEVETEDGVVCGHYAAMLRWNRKDPMPQAYDDFFNDHANAVGVEEAYGRFLVGTADELPRVQRAIERRFRIARLVEQLLPYIAERGK